tara:strand:+ start:344 stop:466 length:123 start_codon:yes stop_codon:yes gene_type:complete
MEELTSKIFVEPAIDKKIVALCEGISTIEIVRYVKIVLKN